LISAVWSLFCLLIIPFGPQLIAIFSDTPAVMTAGGRYLLCVMPFYIPFSVMFSLNNAMRGAGDSMFALVDVILSMILVRVPVVYLLANRFGPDYMFLGIGVGWCVGCLLSVLYYFSGRWKRRKSLTE
jgi:Na+-driven multidrug efflux pump